MAPSLNVCAKAYLANGWSAIAAARPALGKRTIAVVAAPVAGLDTDENPPDGREDEAVDEHPDQNA